MHFNHLGLPVRDERRSQQFYSAYFSFDASKNGASLMPSIISTREGRVAFSRSKRSRASAVPSGHP
jgi:catechol 2,3-dioxygenase-like lactoylglutathione lyase family enzyme